MHVWYNGYYCCKSKVLFPFWRTICQNLVIQGSICSGTHNCTSGYKLYENSYRYISGDLSRISLEVLLIMII